MPRITVVLMMCVLASAGCNRQTKLSTDPLEDVRNARLGNEHRVRAIHAAWDQVELGVADRLAVRDELKTVAWSGKWPLELRMAALTDLAKDRTERGAADTREMFRMMLPREPMPEVTAYLADKVAAEGWSEATPSLVRSLSRTWPGTPDTARPEYKAIERLNGGKSVQEVVYDVFLNPPEESGAFGLLPAERVRADAWDLLVRVDPDGSVRARLLEDRSGGEAGPVADMRASLEDLRAMPLSGDELRWLGSMRNFRDAAKKRWWDESAAAVARVDRGLAPRLQFRHIEPIRWAAAQHPEWLSASRESLLSEVARRLDGRAYHKRRARDQQVWKPPSERLADWQDKLSWADLIAILAVDEAIKERPVVESLFAQAQMDREDRTAEYGGVLRARSGGTGPLAVLYPPRPGSRIGDREFVASQDMIAQSDDSLAHYHFHAQEERNSEYAGPSLNDLAYAARQGRTCLVLTSIASGVLNVDLFQPDGAVIDLGTIQRR